MKGTIQFTDPSHRLATRSIYPAQQVPGAEQLSVSETGFQGFYGFGVAITPSSCYLLSQMEPDQRRALLTRIYGKEGLGLSVARLCIGSSDYSPELYSYDDVAFDTDLTHFSVARDEAYIIPMIQEILQINPDLYLFASPWSPPYWMKTGGSMCGGYMREAFVDVYADYILKFLEAYEAYGIHISAITPQNEPNTNQNGKMPACIWHPELEAKFINCFRQKCTAAGRDVKIWMFDHNFIDATRVLWMLENCPGVKENCQGAAFHYYNGNLAETAAVTEKYPQLELHFTEGGPRLNDHYDTDWCKWGTMMIQALRTGYRSFTGWNLMLDECGGPNIGPFLGICGGLVTRDGRNGELRESGQYTAFAHIAPYITPESKIYPISGGNTLGWKMGSFPKFRHEIEGVVMETQPGQSVAVLVNPNDHGVQAQISLQGTLWYLELHADSIATIIVEA